MVAEDLNKHLSSDFTRENTMSYVEFYQLFHEVVFESQLC